MKLLKVNLEFTIEDVLEFAKVAVKKAEQKLREKEQECEELKERINTRCFDPKNNNNRCISYNRISQDYKIDLMRLGKYKQTLDEIEEFCTVYSDNHDAYETVYKFILSIINKAKEKECQLNQKIKNCIQ